MMDFKTCINENIIIKENKGVFTNENYLSKNKLEFSHIIELLQKLIKKKINQ